MQRFSRENLSFAANYEGGDQASAKVRSGKKAGVLAISFTSNT